MHPHGVRFGRSASGHPRPEPARDVGRKMSDRLAGRQVHPDLGFVLYRRIRNQADDITFLERLEMSLTVAKDRTVYCGAERGWTPLGERKWIRLQA